MKELLKNMWMAFRINKKKKKKKGWQINKVNQD